MSPPPQSSPLVLSRSLQENSLMALFLSLSLSLSSGGTKDEGEGFTIRCKAMLRSSVPLNKHFKY